LGLSGGTGGGPNFGDNPPKPVIIEPGIPLSDHVDSEATYVGDEHGWIEVDPDLVWSNPETYIWVGYELVDNVMVYYFEFSD